VLQRTKREKWNLTKKERMAVRNVDLKNLRKKVERKIRTESTDVKGAIPKRL